MFTIVQYDDGYTIASDDSGRAFGPFQAVYVHGRAYGNFPLDFSIESYPVHTYALGIGDTGVFVVSRSGIEGIVPYLSVSDTGSSVR